MATRDRPAPTVAAIDPNEVPPGSVGMTLASGRPGIMTSDGEIAAGERAHLSRYEKTQNFLATARRRWRQSADSEAELRRDMLDDLRFYNADQWPDNIKLDRVLDGRPCLTINRLPQFVRQVLNQARQQRPAIQYNPIDGGADVDTAEVLQGLARSIERNSNAPLHYTQAAEHQVVMGRGWLRVRADWLAPDSFDQEILVESTEDPFIVYPDPASWKADGSDLQWAFMIARVPWYEYHVKYPGAERVSMYDWTSVGDDAAQWVNETGVLIAEYYYIEMVAAELVEAEVNIGAPTPLPITVYSDAIRKQDTEPGPEGEPPRLTIVRRRPTVRRQLKWATINGIEVLEGNEQKTGGRDLPGPYIPLVPMQGEKLVVNGKRNLRGMVRDAKDPQRTYNFWVSAETEMIALAPRAPVIGAVGQFETTKEQWLLANRRNFPFLEYDPVDINGNLVPAPQRNAFDPNIVPIIQATQQADQDLKSVIGMFDASQEHSREQSGKAILARQAQGEQGTSHFLHNQALAIQQVGRILLHWIPVYYDQPRIVRIIGLDDNERDVLVHAGNPEAAAAKQQEMVENSPLGKTLQSGALFDVGLGRYDVSTSVTPSFQSRRAEAVEAMTQLLQAFPLAAPYALDVIAKNMDWPGARELSERFKHLVPPEAREDAENIPPQAKQQIEQMKQQLDEATQQLQQMQQVIETKATEQRGLAEIRKLELASNERLAQAKAELEIVKIKEKAMAEAALAKLESQLEHFAQQAEFLHERRMQLEAPPEVSAGPAPREQKPVSESLNYKDAPPDVRRQIEMQAGLAPSRMGALELAERAAKATPKPTPQPKAATPNTRGASLLLGSRKKTPAAGKKPAPKT
jgi:tetratricopeptide (TPR) repeat protein